MSRSFGMSGPARRAADTCGSRGGSAMQEGDGGDAARGFCRLVAPSAPGFCVAIAPMPPVGCPAVVRAVTGGGPRAAIVSGGRFRRAALGADVGDGNGNADELLDVAQ